MVVKRRYSPTSTLWIGCILAVAGAALLGERAASQQQPSKLLFLTHDLRFWSLMSGAFAH